LVFRVISTKFFSQGFFVNDKTWDAEQIFMGQGLFP